MSTIQGKVKWFNGKKGYGFIERDDKEKDVFVHISAVKESGISKLFDNDRVEFELAQDEKGKGPSATALRKLISYFIYFKHDKTTKVVISAFSFIGWLIIIMI